MTDLLFVLALVVPPVVVMLCFTLLALPVRRQVKTARQIPIALLIRRTLSTRRRPGTYRAPSGPRPVFITTLTSD
ncbi:MAG: hypothetical protein QM736_20080 [Vicinamibacterales bacterium]